MMQSVGAQGYTTQATPSASAVNIQIFEPKAYASPQGYQNSCYSYPQQSMYAPQPFVNQYQQFIPQQQQIYQPVPMYQPTTYPQQQIYQQAPMYQPTTYPQQSAQNATFPVQPQEMPAPVLTHPEATQTPVQQPAPQEVAGQPATAESVQVTPPAEPSQEIDANALLAGINSPDNKTQEEAITKVAEYCMGSPEQQTAVLTEPVMQALVNIVKQDTSGLQGPTDAQVAALNKAASGEQLTPEEEALVNNLSPKTLADKNRVIAMYTLGMLQKNQRDEIDRYNAAQDQQNQLPQIKLSDLIGFNEIENVARNDGDAEVRLAALQSLAYAGRIEDKETLEPIMAEALKSPEPAIQKIAGEILNNIGSSLAPSAQDAVSDKSETVNTQNAEQKKKLSRAEKRAQRKAQREAEKAEKVDKKAA